MPLKLSPVLRYILPFFTFIFLGQLQTAALPGSIFWIYGLKILLTGAALLYCFHGHWNEIEGKFDLKAVGLGILVFILWILPETFFPGQREVSFDPTGLNSKGLRIAAIAIRMIGAVLIVPLVEEIFFRGFLMRYLIRQNFLEIPPGAYTAVSFWGTSICFGILHTPWQWGVAIVTGILYGGYLVKTGNLKGCILAHAITNLALGIYVITTGQWKFW